jgi:hypothetical protein
MAAGLGFKTFTTGEVLTAADTNGYLMQGVLVFASAAARDAAITSPQEGQCCYLKDTDAVLTYSGAAWVGFDDSNAIQNTIVDAKGDLIGATAADTPARLAVGTNGQVLTADSTAATGLAWATASTSATSLGYTAGKNKLINGDFSINQRSFTTTSTSGTYGFDRWVMQKGGTDGTCTYTPQTFTAGTAPVAGYEATNFARLVTAAGTATNVFAFLGQRIEDVRTYANQTITVSFWAKAASGTPKIAVDVEQYFGSGGSTQVNTPAGAVTISTSWARYSVTVTVPTISGTTIGAGSYTGILLWVSAGSTFNTRASSIGIQNNTFDVWGVQSEIGSTLTAFQTATGILQGELAACSRYFRICSSASGINTGGTAMQCTIYHYGMRTTPSVAVTAAVTYTDVTTADFTQSVAGITIIENDANGGRYQSQNFTGATPNRPYILISSGGKIQLSAEL